MIVDLIYGRGEFQLFVVLTRVGSECQISFKQTCRFPKPAVIGHCSGLDGNAQRASRAGLSRGGPRGRVLLASQDTVLYQ